MSQLLFANSPVDIFERQWREPTDDYLAKFAAWVERLGFKRDIAGAEFFDEAIKVAATARLNHLGVFAFGPPGTGKTLFIRSISRPFVPNSNITYYFNLKDPNAIKSMRDYADFYCKQDIVIDDLGCEAMINEYGVLHEPAIELIQAHWALNEYLPPEKRHTVSVATNLDEEGLHRYSKRIDFVHEMMLPIEFNGESKREWGGKKLNGKEIQND